MGSLFVIGEVPTSLKCDQREQMRFRGQVVHSLSTELDPSVDCPSITNAQGSLYIRSFPVEPFRKKCDFDLILFNSHGIWYSLPSTSLTRGLQRSPNMNIYHDPFQGDLTSPAVQCHTFHVLVANLSPCLICKLNFVVEMYT